MIRVFLADDHALVREGMKRIVSPHPDIRLVGEAASGEEVLCAYQPSSWDVLVLDLSLRGLSGAEVLRRLRERDSRLRVLMVSMQEEDSYALRLIKSGADGYLSKSRSPDEIVTAIRALATDGKYLTGKLAALLLDGDRGNAAPLAALSDRELEIFRLLVSGRAPSLVAASLDLAPSTVSTHIGRIKTKLKRHTTAELVALALEAGILRPPGAPADPDA